MQCYKEEVVEIFKTESQFSAQATAVLQQPPLTAAKSRLTWGELFPSTVRSGTSDNVGLTKLTTSEEKAPLQSALTGQAKESTMTGAKYSQPVTVTSVTRSTTANVANPYLASENRLAFILTSKLNVLERQSYLMNSGAIAIDDYSFSDGNKQAQFAKAQERYRRLAREYEAESAAYHQQIQQLEQQTGFWRSIAATTTKDDLESTIGAKVFAKRVQLDDLQMEMRSYVKEDLARQVNAVKAKLSINELAQSHQARVAMGNEFGFKDVTGVVGILFSAGARELGTRLAGFTARHERSLLALGVATAVAAPIGTVTAAVTYGVLSTHAVDSRVLSGLDLALEGLGVDRYSRADIANAATEGMKFAAAGAAARTAPRYLSPEAIRGGYRAARTFGESYGVQNPLVFKFNSTRLDSSFGIIPLDAVSLRSPVVRKSIGMTNPTIKPNVLWADSDVLSIRALNHPSPLTKPEQEVVMQWMVERKALLDKWAAQDLSAVNETMFDLLKKTHNQLRDHMRPDDLAALLKEQRGITIVTPRGTIYNHFQEWDGAQRSLQKALHGPWSNNTNEFSILTDRYGDMSRLWVRYSKLMQTVQAQSRPQI